MARKIDPNAKPAPAPCEKEADGADDLTILHPDLELELAGRKVTVREYRFVPGLRVRAKAKPLVADLQAQIETGEALTEDVIDILAKHEALVRELILESIEEADADWIESLDDHDGQQLLLAWWGVNGPFFLGQIVRRLADRAVFKARLAAASDGATPSPSSSQPATASPTSSAPGTPTVN